MPTVPYSKISGALMHNIQATKNRVIISQVSQEKRSAGGLILDVKQSTDQSRGIVVHIGPGVEGLTVGDSVFLSHVGVSVGENLVSLPSECVVAIEAPL